MVDSNPVTPVATLRPLRFHVVAKEAATDTRTDATASAAVANCAAANHVDAEHQHEIDLSNLVVDVPEGWAPSLPHHSNQAPHVPLPPAHACAARICGHSAAGYFSLQTFGGHVDAVEAYTSCLSAFGPLQRIHDDHASGIAQLASHLSGVAVDTNGGAVAGGAPGVTDKCTSGHTDGQLDYESPDATGAAVAACLDVLGKGMLPHAVVRSTICV